MSPTVVLRTRSKVMLLDQFGQPVMSAYVGAQRDRRSLRAWRPDGGSANADLLPELGELRNRSEDLARNHPLGAGAIRKNVTSVIGTGLRPRPRIDRELLGLSQEQEQAWERQALRIYRLASQQLDFSRHQDMMGLQSVAFRGTLARGDVLVVRRYRKRGGDLLGVKVQLIEGDRVCNPNFTMDTDRIAGGVEVNDDGVPVAYHVLNQHPGDHVLARRPATWSRVPAWGPATGDRLAFLLFERDRPEQVRGVPYLTPILEHLKQVGRYSESELMRTVVQSLLTVFVKSARAEGLAAIDTDEEDDAATDLRLGHGNIVDLAPGEDVETVQTTAPNPNFREFLETFLDHMGAGIELPGEMWIGKFTTTYSAARAAFIEAWKRWKTRRVWIAGGFCQPLYGWILGEAIERGLIEAPGFEDPLVRAAWLGAQWIGDAAGQIDPLKEVEAARARIDLGLSSVEEEAAELRGNDFLEVHEQRAYEKRLRVAAGLEAGTPVSPAPAAVPPARPRPDDDPDAADRAERDEARREQPAEAAA